MRSEAGGHAYEQAAIGGGGGPGEMEGGLVAGDFLGHAEFAFGEAHERMKSTDQACQEREPSPEEIASLDMSEFVGEDQTQVLGSAGGEEGLGQEDAGPEETDQHGGIGGGARQQARDQGQVQVAAQRHIPEIQRTAVQSFAAEA